jgi:ATP-binding cassette subfamily F protein uup
VFEGDGRLAEYVGGYDDWLRQCKPEEPARADKAARTEKPRTRLERPRILTFKENKELEALPGLIESLESERGDIYKSLADPDFYRQAGNRVPEAEARIREIEIEVAAAYERWDILESIRQLAQ